MKESLFETYAISDDGRHAVLKAAERRGGTGYTGPLYAVDQGEWLRQSGPPSGNPLEFSWFPCRDNRDVLIYASGAAYRTAAENLVYCCWVDLSGDSGCTSGSGRGSSVTSTCKSRIWFSRSVDDSRMCQAKP
jgi:hypothetical protein